MNTSEDSSLNEQNKDTNLNEKSGIGGINPADAINHINQFGNGNKVVHSDNLTKIIATHEKLKQLKASAIKFSEPVLRHGENAVIYPNTINVIQGQAGVHKSRLAEIISSGFLKLIECKNELLGFNKPHSNPTYTIVYVDTERNIAEQLPYALQSIQLNAGFKIEDHPCNFKYISLMQIKRNERFKALEEYLIYIRQNTDNPLFVVLDVSTDCIEDFNRTDKSMELIDLMNMAINEYNVIFLCVIHENPRSEKARGHFGTELMNKASTVMQVGFEKNSNQEDTDIIRVKYLKCRSTAKHIPFYIKFCKDAKGLVLADPSEVSTVINDRKLKALKEDVIEYISLYLGDGSEMKRRDLLNKLCIEFKSKDRTIEERLKEILDDDIDFLNLEGAKCKLSKEKKDKNTYYSLKPNGPF